LIKLKAPSDPVKALLEFGALGSFFEQAHLRNKLPAFGFMEPDRDHKAERFLSSLPPLYTSVIGLDDGRIAAVPADAGARTSRGGWLSATVTGRCPLPIARPWRRRTSASDGPPTGGFADA
jgi:hypothetical protein